MQIHRHGPSGFRHLARRSSYSAQNPSKLTHPPVPSGFPRSPARKAESSISPSPFPDRPWDISPESKKVVKLLDDKKKPFCPFRKNSDIFGRWAGKAAGVLSIGAAAIELLIREERSIFEEPCGFENRIFNRGRRPYSIPKEFSYLWQMGRQSRGRI